MLNVEGKDAKRAYIVERSLFVGAFEACRRAFDDVDLDDEDWLGSSYARGLAYFADHFDEIASLNIARLKLEGDGEYVSRSSFALWKDFAPFAAAEYHRAVMLADDALLAEFDRLVDEHNASLREKGDQLFKWSHANDATSALDKDFWYAMPAWSTDEIVAISLGKDPRRVSFERGLFKSPTSRYSSFLQEYERRYHILKRAVAIGELSSPAPRGAAIGYCAKVGLSFDGSSNIEIENVDWKALYQNATAELDQERIRVAALEERLAQPEHQNTKSMRSLYRMLLGMALAKYGYHPVKNNSAGKRIAGDLEDLGLPVTDDTIRSRLGEAVTDLEYQVPSET